MLDRKAAIEEALGERLPAADIGPRRVHEAMRYAVLGTGKRLRPIIATGVGDLAGAPFEQVIDSACAIEFVHAASLILDDLPSMDNAIVLIVICSLHPLCCGVPRKIDRHAFNDWMCEVNDSHQ